SSFALQLFKLREKFVILRLSKSQSTNGSSISADVNRPSVSKTSSIEASSNKDLLEIFRNCLNSCACMLPDRSAMLFVRDSPAARSCSNDTSGASQVYPRGCET